MKERAIEKEKFTKILIKNKKRLADLARQEIEAKEQDTALFRENMAREEAMQRKREAEFQARLDSIQKKMEKMGGTFDDAKKEEEREERRIIALQNEKDRRDIENERQKREQKFNQSQMINS